LGVSRELTSWTVAMIAGRDIGDGGYGASRFHGAGV
jgi:hypothetical protein